MARFFMVHGVYTCIYNLQKLNYHNRNTLHRQWWSPMITRGNGIIPATTFWIKLLLCHCYLTVVTIIPMLSTVFSVIRLHKMGCLTFSCLTTYKSFNRCMSDLLKLKKVQNMVSEKSKMAALVKESTKFYTTPWKYIIT